MAVVFRPNFLPVIPGFQRIGTAKLEFSSITENVRRPPCDPGNLLFKPKNEKWFGNEVLQGLEAFNRAGTYTLTLPQAVLVLTPQ